jgi:ABC-type multidrug transport system fused ATPase/permease subunit
VVNAGVVIAFALGMQSALTKFIDLMKNVFVLEASGPALKRLTDIVQDRIPSFVEEESDPRQLGNVAMKGVSFAFQPVISGGEMESCLFDKASTKPTTPGVQVFKDLSFSIAAGRKVAVVGGSGSGKSLLFKVRCAAPCVYI